MRVFQFLKIIAVGSFVFLPLFKTLFVNRLFQWSLNLMPIFYITLQQARSKTLPVLDLQYAVDLQEVR